MVTSMRLLDHPIAAAKLIGGRLCLDFVNTCAGRNSDGTVIEDRLLDFTDLAAWANRAALESGPAAQKMIADAVRDPAAAAKIRERAAVLREACYRLFRGVLHQKPASAGDVAILNREWTEALRHRMLAPGSTCLQLKWTGSDALDRTLWAVAESAVQLLASPHTASLKECGGVRCGWLFEDSSRNLNRQWCDMQSCGTLSKVRRFRERQTQV